MELIYEIGSPENTEKIILEKLGQKVKIPGFGHRVYSCEDPRVPVLREHARNIAGHTGNETDFNITREIERVVVDRTKVFANVDLYTASLYGAIGLEPELFTLIFAISRVVGWTSHIFEQWSNNRLIRPRAEYTGHTDLHYRNIGDRPH